MLTKSRGHATDDDARDRGDGRLCPLYACSGDGTVNEIANGIAGFPNAAMTCIPIGTGNDFLKTSVRTPSRCFLTRKTPNGTVT